MLGKLNQGQIEELLHTQVVGRIGCHHAGKTYVVPITYVYDGEHIIGHTQDGMKIHIMRALKDKIPRGEYLVMLSQYESLGGQLVSWSKIRTHGTCDFTHGYLVFYQNQ